MMARMGILVLLFIGCSKGSPMGGSDNNNNGPPPVTCPGFPGYCSESYPGDTCLVVCAFGRNNVPECQPDGTWTDVPRCIEHEPGIPEQVPGICPGIPGYCSLDYPGALCEFDCLTGPDISSICTPDGTWDPYPTCEGDIRETRDGCKECPGPFGGPRNRSAEGNSSGNRRNNGGSSNVNNGVQTSISNKPSRPNSTSGSNRQNNMNQGGGNRNANGGGGGNNGRPNNNRRPNGNQAHNNNGRPNGNQSHNNNNNNGRPNGNQAHNNNNGRPNGNQAHKSNFQSQGGFQSNSVSSGNTSQGGGARCPGNSLEACLDACPSTSKRIFKACVSSCDRRCPNKK